LVRAVTGGGPVVDYVVGNRLKHVAGWAHRGSSAPLFSADNPRTCC
jgi:phosphopantothenate synthetase